METELAHPTAPPPARHQEFDWAIYADATLAGLASLIPLPYVDSAFEAHFRRRMVHSIATQRSRALHPSAIRALQDTQLPNPLKSVLMAPANLSLGLVKRFSRKVVYVLSMKAAVDALTYYWRRAYLLDYMVRRGHLSDESTARASVAAMNTVLTQSGSGPFRWLAQRVVEGTPNVVRLLWQARHGDKGHNDSLLLNLRSLLADQWPEPEEYLQMLTRRYEEQYANIRPSALHMEPAGLRLPRLQEQA